MSYLVLARKSRPQTFEEVVGQRAVVRTLQNALARDRVAHAILFSGVRGVGKTTLARIMAKALNCEKGPAPTPCNSCRSCTEIASGSSIDLHEVDGASNRGIQEIRELKEKIRFMPTSSRFKIFIIDEVHMLTTEAFNALLKTLEEPPEHVFFMFATTELHRVPVTILSRCQRYELKRVAHSELFAHFSGIAAKENVVIEPAAMNLVVREAGGSVRDGLSLLDQLFSYCDKEVKVDDVVDILGLVGGELVSDIAVSLLTGDLEAALNHLDQIYGYGMDLKRFINDLLEWFRALVVCKISRDPAKLLDLPEDELNVLFATAADYSVETLSFMFHSLFESLEKVTFSARPRFALEMALIRAVQVRDVAPVSDILGKLDDLLATMPNAAARPVARDAAGMPGQGRAIGNESKPPTISREASPGERRQVVAAVSRTEPESVSLPPENLQATKKQQITSDSIRSAEPSLLHSDTARKNIRQLWKGFVEYVRERKRWMAGALERASGVQLENDELVICYNDAVDCRLLKNRENITPLTEFALDYFQKNFKIKFKVPDSDACEVESENGTGPRRERQELANDALVLMALDIFNGQVGDIRVGPRFRKSLTLSEKMRDEEGEDEI